MTAQGNVCHIAMDSRQRRCSLWVLLRWPQCSLDDAVHIYTLGTPMTALAQLQVLIHQFLHDREHAKHNTDCCCDQHVWPAATEIDHPMQRGLPSDVGTSCRYTRSLTLFN